MIKTRHINPYRRSAMLLLVVVVIATALLSLRAGSVGAAAVSLSKPTAGPAPPRELFPPAVAVILQRSCAACHAQSSQLPWYAHVPIAADLIEEDIRRGRRVFNLSHWQDPPQVAVDEYNGLLTAICEEVSSGNMPPQRYQYLHWNARPTVAEVQTVCRWSQSAQRKSESKKP